MFWLVTKPLSFSVKPFRLKQEEQKGLTQLGKFFDGAKAASQFAFDVFAEVRGLSMSL